mmetsp:Transcript_49441/g.142172  ORF Transcript_49441/g.142172 Transcript_49441/m.142172 type:complete len:412 (-) Transcript_49441:73-1308(-)
MNNPHLKSVLVAYPDVDVASLNWPGDADTWERKELDMFIGSGGFIKPKKKQQSSAAAGGGTARPAAAATPTPQAATASAGKTSAAEQSSPSSAVEEQPSSFEVPGFSRERHAITLPVRVHCEDTAPNGHIRMESLVAFSERIRSLSLKQIMSLSLADLRERERLAILATEYVCEIVGPGFRVLDTLRVDTTPEFPAAPLFPWDVRMLQENGELYAQGIFALNLCSIAADGSYAGIEKDRYDRFTKDMLKWCHPDTSRRRFGGTSLRMFNAYKPSGTPFRPTGRSTETYRVRSSDCDMYNVLFQARVPSMMESCHAKHNLMAMYVNILNSVRPGFELTVHVLHNEDSALFLCVHNNAIVLVAFGHYGVVRPICQEEIKCGSVPGTRLKLLKYLSGGDATKPPPCADYDLSLL